jgi:hypothetical protein
MALAGWERAWDAERVVTLEAAEGRLVPRGLPASLPWPG